MENGLKGIIRVLVVEDSPLMCKVITNILNSDPQIIVAGIAHNGKEAIELVPRLKPNIITMDIHMPVMDGYEATKQIMAYCPTPILVVSTSVFKEGMNKVFKAISYGALDVIDKGAMEAYGDEKSGRELINKIKFLSNIKVITHPLAKLEKESSAKVLNISKRNAPDRIVAIAASTGGPEAIHSILKSLPEDFPCALVIVQHMTSGFVGGLAGWLNDESKINVKVAENGEGLLPGTAYIAPCDSQMRVDENKKIRITDEPPCDGQRPSGSILLESVARVYREGAIGIVLTGMGRDGSIGLSAIKRLGGVTIAQDEKSCVVFGMPKAAIEMNAAKTVLPLEKIAEEIVESLKR